MPHLFDALQLRGLTLPHRVVMAPMCQYSCTDGLATDWHLVHLGSRAIGGASLIITEATAVTAEGRISPDDLGLWSDAHIAPLARITRFLREHGSAAGIQLAHAGRKGSTKVPWAGEGAVLPAAGGWQVVGPGEAPFSDTYPVPRALGRQDIAAVVQAFAAAAVRSLNAGFDVVEIHAAHGYLLHEFLSPLVNTRTDEYGGSLGNRMRLCVEVIDAVRHVWPERLPLFLRISATDWTDGGWDIAQSVELARVAHAHGVDLVDCSSGGAVRAQVPFAPGYQVPFAERIRREAGVPTGAVGLITDPHQANAIVEGGQADIVLLARELLRNPYWPLQAAAALGVTLEWPVQYLRGAPAEAKRRVALTVAPPPQPAPARPSVC
jgi:2,4-dienoyl-CoA reductase-like NADH-dependent reductase (Old Yellow Enzyme family)